MIRAVTRLKAAGKTTFLCLSNANSVFISTILEAKNLRNLFDEIITNPASWETSGLLKLRRRVDPEGPQHKCNVGCSANMCKGQSNSPSTRFSGIIRRCQAKSLKRTWLVRARISTTLRTLVTAATTSARFYD